MAVAPVEQFDVDVRTEVGGDGAAEFLDEREGEVRRGRGVGRGAEFELRRVPLEESGLSPAEIWSNESQERYVLAIRPDDLDRFARIADRERCPYAVVGIATFVRFPSFSSKSAGTISARLSRL